MTLIRLPLKHRPIQKTLIFDNQLCVAGKLLFCSCKDRHGR